ncbi:MAG: aminoacyl-tRNA hydrolase [Verrucomicrobiae bacterium]|nr:aminoacyl-tRNA hydrolase [Verrucomicrobiae bacterium]NNJ42542.1 aminoacyl-tRNA hydrolase [Akkermansiaceae bacterium]
MSAIKLVVGLGNPGRKYEGTRHNIGFLVLDQLATRYGADMANHLKWRAHVAKVPSTATLLMKPQTFMNESGQSVGAALRFYKWTNKNVLVVYDDVDLPYGSLRFRMSGSAGGHNGMKSIIHHLGGDQFPRLKIGIGSAMGDGAKPAKNSMVGHVLGNFSTEERNELENTLATAADAVQLALSEGVEAAANAFNRKNNQNTN